MHNISSIGTVMNAHPAELELRSAGRSSDPHLGRNWSLGVLSAVSNMWQPTPARCISHSESGVAFLSLLSPHSWQSMGSCCVTGEYYIADMH